MQTSPSTTTDLSTLHARLARAGFPTRPTLRSFTEFAVFAALAIAFAGVTLSPAVPVPVRTVTAIVAAWFWMAAAMCGHDAGHGTACRTPWQNRLLGHLSFTLMGGISFPFWVHKHGRHHAHPNVIGKDPDIPVGPIAFSAAQHEQQPELLQRLQRSLNAPAFWVMGSLLLIWELRVAGVLFLKRTRAPLVEWAWMAAHAALWYGLPLLFLPAKVVLLGHVIGAAIMGAFVVISLSPGHLADPLVVRSDDPLSLQVGVSRNYRTPLGLSRFLNGLHRQIEHHLAPNMNHFDLDAAAPLVKAFVEEKGLAYRETGWGQAIADVDHQLRQAWKTPEMNFGRPGVLVPATVKAML